MTPMAAPAEPNAIPLGTGGVDGSTAPETWFRQWGDPFVRNVSVATLTPVLPDPDKATGAAVIVAPGGGFLFLSMGNEGWEVAHALADHGVAAFVLKYRVRPTPADMGQFEQAQNAMFAGAAARPSTPNAGPPPNFREMLADPVEDATAAFALIRAHAQQWKVDPNRIGMIGFSAGAGTTMATALNAPQTRPAFLGSFYGGMNAVQVPADAPPLFVALAADDPLFGGRGFGLVQSWQDAGRPVELHYYQNGGHGFGLGNPGKTSNDWFDTFMHWLDVNGFLTRTH
ncbi:MAG: alpha/beta hydrolase [Pseudomonadota bacterium]